MPKKKDNFEHSRVVTLPKSAEFYTKKRAFRFSVDKEACAYKGTVNGKSVQLAIAKPVANLLKNYQKTAISASLGAITEAAMQFYQGETSVDWPAERYADKLHGLRYDVGLAFEETTSGSIAHIDPTIVHGEARKPVVEMLAYGLSLIAAAQISQVSFDRFYFLLGNKSRPDFAASVTASDFVSETSITRLIGKRGLNLGVESKGRAKHGGFIISKGDNKGEATDELQSMLKKYDAYSGNSHAFLGFLVTTELKRASGEGHTRIALADPGEVTHLRGYDLTRALLGCLLPKLRRIGAWASLLAAADWLESLDESLSIDERAYLGTLPNTDVGLLSESVDDHSYVGRFFSDVVRRLGPQPMRAPQIPRDEIQWRLDANDYGELWFAGVDVDIVDAIARRDSDALKRVGLPKSQPATVRVPWESPAHGSFVLSALRQALPEAH